MYVRAYEPHRPATAYQMRDDGIFLTWHIRPCPRALGHWLEHNNDDPGILGARTGAQRAKTQTAQVAPHPTDAGGGGAHRAVAEHHLRGHRCGDISGPGPAWGAQRRVARIGNRGLD